MFRKTDRRRRPVVRAVSRRDAVPARTDAVLVCLAVWLALLTGAAALERVKLPPMPVPPVTDTLPMSALYAGF